jgi:hypothetical protein
VKPDLKPGQKLWFVQTSYRALDPDAGTEVTVEKVGRIWATLSNRDRVDARLRVDGGYAQCYLSRAHFQAHLLVVAAWTEVQVKLSRCHLPPPGVTVGDIATALQVLRLD